MKQTTKFLHILMCMVLGLSVSMTSCKDYDDDIDGLNQRVDALEKSLSELSTDFGSLAYVKSVTFADGVLTVTPSEGQAQAYTIPDEDTNTTYSLDVQSDGQKVTITLKGNDGSSDVKSFDLPQAESFDGKNLTVDNDGYICYNGVPTGVKLPEATAAFDASKLTLGDDNCVYYNGEKTGVELDVFNPALLTVKDNKVLYAGEETGVTLPVAPKLDIKEIKDGSGAIIAYAITYGDNETVNLKVVSEKLQGLVFIPDFYYQGIEAMSAYTFFYNELKDMPAANADAKFEDYEEPVKGDEASVTPNFVARYHLNPSNVRADLLKVENMKFLAEDKMYTKAAGVVMPEILDRTVENGILTVQANLSEGLLKDIEKDGEVTVLALQVGTRGEAGDTLITSDYAAIKAVSLENLVLGDATKGEIQDVHFYTTAQEAIDNKPQFNIAWNNDKGLDVAELVNTHYDYILGDNTAHHMLDANAATGDSKLYGLKYSFGLVGYTDGNNLTSQSAHAAFDGSILRAQMTKDGKQQAFGAEQSRATIGRMPLVRVVLTDTISKKDVAVAYIKFLIVEEGEEEPKDEVTVIPTFTFDDDYTVSCDPNNLYFKLNWAQVEEQIYSTLNLSKEEFETTYDLEGYESDDEPTGNSANQYTSTDLTAKEVESKLGSVLRKVEVEGGQMTEVLEWGVTALEAYENLVAKESMSVIVRFEKENNNGTHHYVYVTFQWKPAVRNVTPQGEILDNAETKFPNAWFAHNSNTQGWSEVHFNVAVPTSENDNNSANCTFRQNMLNAFTGQEVLVSNVADVYEAFQTGLKTTFKFITPDVKEVKGVDGKTYVLSVSTDGTRLIATDKDNPLAYADVAVLSGTSGNYTNTTVTYQENAIAKAVLNYADHVDLGDGETLTAKVQMNIVNSCDKPIEVLNNEFDVKFLRPISVLPADNAVLEDGPDGGDVIDVADILTFTDWREYAFKDHANYFGFYGVSTININEEAVTIDMGGSKRLLKEVYPEAAVTYTPAEGNIGINNMGTFSWTNGGYTLSADATIYLPVEVTYKWGVVKMEIPVTVKKTVGQD